MEPRLPPGQILTRKWPVLHYSHVPTVDTAAWRFRIWGAVEHPFEIAWSELGEVPRVEVRCDIHCVTRWSRFDNNFSGVPVRALLSRAAPQTSARHVLVHADPDYTTNLPLADLDRSENLLATHHDGEPLAPEHGGPIRWTTVKAGATGVGMEQSVGDAGGVGIALGVSHDPGGGHVLLECIGRPRKVCRKAIGIVVGVR